MSANMDSTVKSVFEELPKEYSVVAIIKCGDKTERFFVKKTEPKTLIVNDNELTFDNTKLEITLQAKKSLLKIKRPNAPIELALHTQSGRAYVSTEEGLTYKSSSEGTVKVSKAARGEIVIKSGSDVCVIL